MIAAMAIAIVVPVAGTFLLAQQDFKSTINDWVVKKTGREIHIDGALGLKPGLELKIYAEGIRYDNAEWASRESAFTAERLELEFSFTGLLQGKVVVREASITGGELWVERSATGSFNLSRSNKSASRTGSPIELPSWLELKQVNVFDSKIFYLHPRQKWDIALEEVTLSSDDIDNYIVVKAAGMLQAVPIEIEGTIGSVRTWFSRSTSIVDLRATLARTGSLSAQGRIDDVFGWRGIDVALFASIDQLRFLSSWFYSQPFDASSIVANARLYQPETVRSMQLRGIDANFWLWGVSMNLTGKIKKLSRLEQIDLIAKADSQFRIERTNLLWQLDHPIRARLDAGLTGESDDLTLDIIHASFEMENLMISAEPGSIENISKNWQRAIPLSAKLLDLAAFGRLSNKNLPSMGEIVAEGNLWKVDKRFSLEDISITNRGAPISVEGAGYLRQIGEEQQGKLDFSARASSQFYQENLKVLPLKSAPGLLPDESTTQIEMHLDAGNNKAVIKSLQFVGPGYVLNGAGEIPDLSEPNILSIDLDGRVVSEEHFYSALGVSLPRIGAISATAELNGTLGHKWGLEDIVVSSLTDDGVFEANGFIDELGPEARSEIKFSMESDARNLIKMMPGLKKLEPFEEELGPTRLSGTLGTSVSAGWSIKALNINTNWNGADVQLTGDLISFGPLEGQIDVHVSGNFDRKPAIIDKYEWLNFSTIDARFSVPLDVQNEIRGIKLKLSDRKAELRMHATLIQTAPLKTEWIRVALDAEDFATLIPFTHSFAPDNALASKFDIAIDQGKIKGSGALTLGNSDIEGTIEWLQGENKRPLVKAVSKAQLLDFKTLFLTEKKDKMFSTKSLAPRWMHNIDGKFELQAKTFRNNLIEVQDLNTTAQFDKGEMRVDFDGFRGDSRVEGFARIQPVGQSEVALKAKQIPMDSILSFSKGGLFQGGVIEADISLKGLGSSLAELLRTGTGSIELGVYRSGIENDALEAVGADLLSNIVALVNPESGRDDFVAVECGVIHFDIENGIATTRNGLALKTDRVTVLGSGEITFPNEEIKLVIAPKPRHGIGISATTVAKMIRVGGTLTQPEIEADPTGFFKSGAAIGAAIFSGGLSLVAQGLLDRVRANSEVCKIAQGLISLEPKIRDDVIESR